MARKTFFTILFIVVEIFILSLIVLIMTEKISARIETLRLESVYAVRGFAW